MVMRRFNLEEAKEGAKVCTRDGREARIICFDCKSCDNLRPIIALVDDDDLGSEKVESYNYEGRKFFTSINPEDLMLSGEKHVGWVNIFKPHIISRGRAMSMVYNTREEAIKNIGNRFNYITTIQIKWEE